MISAFWHGFYPAYYYSFALWFMQLYLQGLIFKYCKNGNSLLVRMYRKGGKVAKVFLSFLVQFSFSHCAVCFLILDNANCWAYFKSVHFIPQMVLLGLTVIFSMVRPPKDEHRHS